MALLLCGKGLGVLELQEMGQRTRISGDRKRQLGMRPEAYDRMVDDLATLLGEAEPAECYGCPHTQPFACFRCPVLEELKGLGRGAEELNREGD